MAEEKVSELLAANCPFCGGPARTYQYNGTTQATCAADYVECAGSDVSAPVGMWNRRTHTPVTEDVGDDLLTTVWQLLQTVHQPPQKADRHYWHVTAWKHEEFGRIISRLSAMLSASPSPPKADGPGEVSVKPLVWQTNSPVSIWSSELIFGVYYIVYDEGDGHRAFRKCFLSEGEDEIAFSADIEAAKAAALADYEASIRSALVSTSIKREA